jgi:hypothetical protein
LRSIDRAARLGETRSDLILETHGLTKEFVGFFAVRDVSLSRCAVAAFMQWVTVVFRALTFAPA